MCLKDEFRSKHQKLGLYSFLLSGWIWTDSVRFSSMFELKVFLTFHTTSWASPFPLSRLLWRSCNLNLLKTLSNIVNRRNDLSIATSTCCFWYFWVPNRRRVWNNSIGWIFLWKSINVGDERIRWKILLYSINYFHMNIYFVKENDMKKDRFLLKLFFFKL